MARLTARGLDPHDGFRTRIKVCCIATSEEASAAIGFGADALGLVGPMPSGPGTIDDEVSARIAASVPPPVATFLLTSETTAEGIASHVERVRPTTVQIVQHIDPGESAQLTRLIPSVRRVQVVHVEGPEALERIAVYQEHVHAFLLDSGRPSAPIAELGGTGRVHDWRVSRAFVEQSPLPVFLAGGLAPGNVAEAIRAVRPYGVDLCSGVRKQGELDRRLLRGFVGAVAEVDSDAVRLSS